MKSRGNFHLLGYAFLALLLGAPALADVEYEIVVTQNKMMNTNFERSKKNQPAFKQVEDEPDLYAAPATQVRTLEPSMNPNLNPSAPRPVPVAKPVAPISERGVRLKQELANIEAEYLQFIAERGIVPPKGQYYVRKRHIDSHRRKLNDHLCGEWAKQKYDVIEANCENLAHQLDELEADLEELNREGLNSREGFLMGKKDQHYQDEERRLTFSRNGLWQQNR